MENAFKKCIELDPKKPDSYTEMGKAYFNQAVEYSEQMDAIKGKTPEDQAKKKDFKTKAEGKINLAIPYFEKSFSIYEAMTQRDTGAKSRYKSIAQLLRDCYSFIDNVEKSKYYEKKIDEITSSK